MQDNNIKVLVLVADYPNSQGRITMMYVHTRNKYYAENGLKVTVLNFKTEHDYVYDGIQVISLGTFKNTLYKDFDILVLHAANIRNHYIFLKKYQRHFDKLIFFFHGHEILPVNKVYPKPYYYVKKNCIRKYFRNAYDIFKVILWRSYFFRNKNKVHFVFVSNWMYNEFHKWTRIPLDIFKAYSDVIYNCTDDYFEKEKYDPNINKEYDFITIRSDLDGTKYSIDFVNELAKANQNYKFLVIGRGRFFNHYKKADNIEWLDTYLDHAQITYYLNKSRCALMPTRTDAQGLMMCEMATFGMPVITSNLSVCREVLNGFDNVDFIDNDKTDKDIGKILNDLIFNLPYEENDTYYKKNTCAKEIKVMTNLLSMKG